MTWACKIDGAGDQADMLKTIENYWFSMIFEGWGVLLEAWRALGWLGFWGTEWLKGGWLEGWLVMTGVAWMLAGGQGGHGDP